MTAAILDGKALSLRIQQELSEEVVDFIQNNGVVPCLAVILVGDNPAGEVYVRHKRSACEKVGIESRPHRLGAEATQEDLLKLIAKLNKDEGVHGILVQLPLPPGIETRRILHAVSPMKDVDAFHPENVGRMVQGQPRFLPCTPRGVQRLLIENRIDVAGKEVVILGRSDIVGKPLANMLLQRGPGADATVTVCHTRTPNTAEIARRADILVAAVGRPKFVTAEMVKPGAAVIDVGIHRTQQGLIGDVDFEAVKQVAGWISPVPGGVGPLTVAMLLVNTLHAAKLLQV